MLTRVDLTLDCANPEVLAEFWKTAAGYVDEPRRRRSRRVMSGSRSSPPRKTTTGWVRRGCMTRTASRLGCACFRCPSPRLRKNRLHLDLRVSGDGTPEHKWSRVTDEVARLSAAGAVALHTFAGHHVV